MSIYDIDIVTLTVYCNGFQSESTPDRITTTSKAVHSTLLKCFITFIKYTNKFYSFNWYHRSRCLEDLMMLETLTVTTNSNMSTFKKAPNILSYLLVSGSQILARGRASHAPAHCSHQGLQARVRLCTRSLLATLATADPLQSLSSARASHHRGQASRHWQPPALHCNAL